ncbi:hypothetical protein C366_06152 [Cryptococcus neoformans Tu401-1]|nr:hypothetical protein C366_06152 [Cryptococcus neoformans var. grubii Tu401-1]OXM76291.1 hypothetical protein C364_06124 [Cryptococcus neoformans var. grubii Bt63]
MNRPIQPSGEPVRPHRRNPFSSLQARTRRIRGRRRPAGSGGNSIGNRQDLPHSVHSWRSNRNPPQCSVETSDGTLSVTVNFVTYPSYPADAGSPSCEGLMNPFSYPTNEEVNQLSSTSASNYNGDNDAVSVGQQSFVPIFLDGDSSPSDFTGSETRRNEAGNDADTVVQIRFSTAQTGNTDASISLYPPDRSEYPEVDQWMELVYTQGGRGSQDEPIGMNDAIHRHLQPNAESWNSVRELVLQALWMSHTSGERRFDLRETADDEQ